MATAIAKITQTGIFNNGASVIQKGGAGNSSIIAQTGDNNEDRRRPPRPMRA